MNSKVVLITGCSSGFGLDLVKLFLEEDYFVIATMRNAENRLELLGEMPSAFSEKLIVKNLDITSEVERENLIKIIETQFSGKLDILVNNAGYGIFGALEDCSEEQMRNVFEVNFFGSALLTKAVLPFLRKQKGKIFNLSSIMGRSSLPLGGIYSASKYALEGLTEGLFYECREFGIQVCSIQPGGHRTKFISSLVWAENAFSEDSAYRKMSLGLKTMMDRMTARPKAPMASNVTAKIVKLAAQKKIPRSVVVGGDALFVKVLQAILPCDYYQRLTRFVYHKTFQKVLR